MSFEELFCEIMEQEDLPQNFETLEIGDISEWDSLANMNFLMALEKKFSVRFSFDDMAELNSITMIRNKLTILLK